MRNAVEGFKKIAVDLAGGLFHLTAEASGRSDDIMEFEGLSHVVWNA